MEVEVPKELVDKIKKEMYKYSPEMEGIEPTIETKEISLPPKAAKKIGIKKMEPKRVHTFSFRKTMTAEDGAKIPIVTRITTDEEGNIIKKTGIK